MARPPLLGQGGESALSPVLRVSNGQVLAASSDSTPSRPGPSTWTEGSRLCGDSRHPASQEKPNPPCDWRDQPCRNGFNICSHRGVSVRLTRTPELQIADQFCKTTHSLLPRRSSIQQPRGAGRSRRRCKMREAVEGRMLRSVWDRSAGHEGGDA